jgi:hypothetical protein
MIKQHTGWCGLLLLLAVPCLGRGRVRAYYADDFIQTMDGSFQLKIRGNFHLDTRIFQSDARGAPSKRDSRTSDPQS